jgi:hypothetical protein
MKACLNRILQVSVLIFIFILTGCGGGGSSGDGDNSALYEGIPNPDAHSGVNFQESGLYSLTSSGKTKGRIGKAAVVEYGENFSFDNSNGDWAFGLDKQALTAKLGENTINSYEAGLNNFIDDIISHPTVLTKLNDAVNSFPLFTGVHTFTESDFSGKAQLRSISVADGAYDANGTPKSLIRVGLAIPAVFTDNNSSAMSACSTEIAEVMSADSDGTFVQPANAVWTYGVDINLIFVIDDQSALHTAKVEDNNITEAEVDQWANDFGLIVWFLNNLENHNIPSFDVNFSVRSDTELTESVGRVQGQAKGNENATCLMAVDSVMPEASLTIPAITDTAHLNTDYEYYVHKYSADLDMLTAGNEYGSSCLNDKDGNMITIGDVTSCAAGNGGYTLLSDGRSKDSPITVISPYAPRQDYAEVRLTKGFCNSSPWNKMRTGRFGRGIIISLTEWAVHGQVADYWNIHWYQRPGAAAVQTAISEAATIAKLAAKLAIGGTWLDIIAAGAEQDYNLVKKLNISIAGYQIGSSNSSKFSDFLTLLLMYGTTSMEAKKYAQNLAAKQTITALAQVAQTQATGWQDFYSGSHWACGFQFK